MKLSALKYAILSWVSGFTMVIILLMPFHALLTVWGSSLIGHYTAFRLWKEVLLALCAAGVLLLIAIDHKIRYHTLSRRLVWLIFSYIAINIIWGLLAWNQHDVSTKALGYGLIVNLRFLIFFMVTWAVALRLSRLRKNWQWLVYWPAALVVLFGLLQVTVLPYDFLKHLGYGLGTIPAYETINHNIHYLRYASTLRGANPLGAYLLIPISLLVVLLLRADKRSWRQAVFLTSSFAMLFFTFSRSAWIGAVLSVCVILGFSIKTDGAKKTVITIALGLLLIGGGAAFWLKNNVHYQNFIFHTQDNSKITVSSNEGHVAAFRYGLEDLQKDPLGRGTGTAGPASVYNQGHPPRIAENYFIQIGQETGLIGMGIFILINLGVGALLFVRRADPLALSLFASFVGLTFVNLFWHAWTDDTLAYVWWGLAGLAMASQPNGKKPDPDAK